MFRDDYNKKINRYYDTLNNILLNCNNETYKLAPVVTVARWSRGMILALGARGPGFKSRTGPFLRITSDGG